MSGLVRVVERQRDVAPATRFARGRQVDQAIEAFHVLLDDLGDRVFDHLGRSTRVVALMLTEGGAMFGYIEIGSCVIASAAKQHDDDRDDPREDRPVDEKTCHADPGLRL